MKSLNGSLFSLIFFLLVGNTAAQPPDTLWSALYGGPGASADVGECVQQTSDRGFIAIGHLDYHNIWLVKTDPLGNLEWDHAYGEYQYGLHGDYVQQTTDGGYVMIGGAAGGVTDILLIKTDSLGTEQWTTELSGSFPSNHGYCVVQTTDGGYALTGHSMIHVEGPPPYGSAVQHLLLIKTDSLGNMEWSRQYHQAILHQSLSGQRLLQDEDGGYVICGVIFNEGTLLMKTDSYGGVIWQHQYMGSSTNDLDATSAGGYIVSEQYNFQPVLFMTDELGRQLWWNQYNFAPFSHPRGVRQASDGGFLVGGYDGAGSSTNSMAFEIDSGGILEWYILLDMSPYNEHIYSIALCADGGFVLCGSAEVNSTYKDMLLIRFGGPYAVTAMPLLSPVIIPPEGGSFDYRLELINTSDDNLECISVWIDLTMPDSSHIDTTSIVSDTSIAPLDTLTWSLSQYVDALAPFGIWHLNAYAGEFPINTGKMASFQFEKSAELSCSFEQRHSVYPAISVHPCPFNATTLVGFTLPQAGNAHLAVYDLSGCRVAELVNGWREAGNHQVVFDGSNLASGIYLAKLEAGSMTATQKLLLLK